jgi:hypothetical protein
MVSCPTVFNAHHSNAKYSPHTSGLVAERSCRKKNVDQEPNTYLLPPSMMHNVCHVCLVEPTMSLLSRDGRLFIRHSRGLLSFPRRRESSRVITHGSPSPTKAFGDDVRSRQNATPMTPTARGKHPSQRPSHGNKVLGRIGKKYSGGTTRKGPSSLRHSRGGRDAPVSLVNLSCSEQD